MKVLKRFKVQVFSSNSINVNMFDVYDRQVYIYNVNQHTFTYKIHTYSSATVLHSFLKKCV